MSASDPLLSARGTAEILRPLLIVGDFEAADRVVTEAVSRLLQASPDEQIADEVLWEPPSTGDVRYDTLLATSLAFALEKRGFDIPAWMTNAPRLRTEWLWDGDAVASKEFRAYIRKATPAVFLNKNILVRERDFMSS